jgi:dipeptidyl aminopeptidase/acylaminoacyl peptidase
MEGAGAVRHQGYYGVTDIYGNLWKPFDFDSTKKYPIIANVYPGPQTEQVTFTFAPTAVPQQLAQLGFIVIQIGNRGGSPQRSQEYQGFSYYNLRDYALADKKAGIEQLAARYKWIDIDRVGIYGHSGGGFMSAAALLQKPYNEFFKS